MANFQYIITNGSSVQVRVKYINTNDQEDKVIIDAETSEVISNISNKNGQNDVIIEQLEDAEQQGSITILFNKEASPFSLGFKNKSGPGNTTNPGGNNTGGGNNP